ncbi:MAG: hypothetical protein ACI87W_000500 [Halieaceae bacterium]|jgi:hypothetical protein
MVGQLLSVSADSANDISGGGVKERFVALGAGLASRQEAQGVVNTVATLATDAKFIAQFLQGPGAVGDGTANLFVRYAITDTYIHMTDVHP